MTGLGQPFKQCFDSLFFSTQASRTSETDSQLPLGGAFILTSRGGRNYGPGDRNQAGWVSLPKSQPELVPMSELHQTAKRAHHEASRFTLFCSRYTEQAPEAQRYRSSASLMIDGLTARHQVPYESPSQVTLVGTVSPVRFEIPARAASHSSKLIPIKGRRQIPNV